MKRFTLPVFLLMFVFAMSSCGQGAASTPPTAIPPETATAKSPQVEDQASLIAGLQSTGATVAVGDTVIQDFFTPEGHIIKVNGMDIQVFEYQNAGAMEKEASQVAPDGGSVGTSMMMWMDAPHFYKAGRIIILYVGSDTTILNLLAKVVGPQFAGR